jgi:hypothetical protein
MLSHEDTQYSPLKAAPHTTLNASHNGTHIVINITISLDHEKINMKQSHQRRHTTPFPEWTLKQKLRQKRMQRRGHSRYGGEKNTVHGIDHSPMDTADDVDPGAMDIDGKVDHSLMNTVGQVDHDAMDTSNHNVQIHKKPIYAKKIRTPVHDGVDELILLLDQFHSQLHPQK